MDVIIRREDGNYAIYSWDNQHIHLFKSDLFDEVMDWCGERGYNVVDIPMGSMFEDGTCGYCGQEQDASCFYCS